MLFYQWKELEKAGFGEALVYDEFEPADRGPVPKNIKTDLDALSKNGLVETKTTHWGNGPRDGRISIKLTRRGRDCRKTLV